MAAARDKGEWRKKVGDATARKQASFGKTTPDFKV
jgi:hypothetical protein